MKRCYVACSTQTARRRESSLYAGDSGCCGGRKVMMTHLRRPRSVWNSNPQKGICAVHRQATAACIFGALLCLGLSNPTPGPAAEPSPPLSPMTPEPAYSLETILTFALSRNPSVTSAEGAIDQNRGYQVAAHTYPNPSVNANTGP